MTIIQAIYVRGHEERPEPKPHVVYRIEVQASVRSWQMWRRYSEFVELNTELAKFTGAEPPVDLPPKHAIGSFFKSKDDKTLTEERRAGLEAYLRAILSAKEEKWRESFAFRDFLGVPVGKQGGMDSTAPSDFTSSSWLDEHLDLQTRIRDIRAEINKRDALSDRGDVSAAHGANVQAKKQLAAVLTRVGKLAQGLDTLGMSGMSEGELRRRTDMISRLQDDCEKLAKMVTVARQTTRGLGAGASSASRDPASQADREALLGGAAAADKPARRVFGAPAPPKETEETRPLDDTGLLQLQQVKVDQQDEQVAQLSAILLRQKQLGMAIGQEIKEQIEMLDDLDHEVDRTGGKLQNAKRQLNRLG